MSHTQYKNYPLFYFRKRKFVQRETCDNVANVNLLSGKLATMSQT